MAHRCFSCGSICHCGGDIDDMVFDTQLYCSCCDWDDILDEDYDDFESCGDCDGHDACRDFGCAIAAGLSHLVNKTLNP